MLVSGTLDTLINGVSQQSPTQRQPSQGELKENCLETVADGCAKRPPTNHIGVLDLDNLGDDENVFVDFLDLGTNGKYAITISDGTMRAFSLADGSEKTVNQSGSYLNLVAPYTENNKAFKLINCADYGLLLNRSVETDDGSVDNGPDLYSTYLVHIREGAYSAQYKIIVTLGAQTYTSTKTTSETSQSDIRTTKIATDLKAGFSPALPSTVTVTQSKNESVLAITYTPSESVAFSDFLVQISDSNGSEMMTNVKNVTQRFTDLPNVAPYPFHIVKVIGENASLSTPYYVKFVPDRTSIAFGKGTWVECAYADGTFSNELDEDTLPHKLSYDSTTDSFTLAPAEWGDRIAGDTSKGSAEFPNFIGSTIQNIFISKNRLGFISKDHVFYSRHGQFHELFPSTVTTLLDTGPIGFNVQDAQTPDLKSAVNYNNSLILFGDRSQFVVDGSELLTPKSPSAEKVTSFNVSHTVDPLVVGSSVYFPFSRGTYSGLYEYYIDNVNGTSDAADSTAAVPRYILGDLYLFTASKDLLILGAESDKSVLYIHKFYWNGDQKLQSSWTLWNTSDEEDTILGAKCYDTDLYLVVQHAAGGAHLEKLSLDTGAVDPGTNFTCLLDRKLSSQGLTVSYNQIDNLTTWTLPYAAPDDLRIVVRTTTGAYAVGQLVATESTDGFTVSCKNDLSSVPVWFGVPYTQTVEPSTQFRRNQQGQPDLTGRLQMRRWKVNYADTGHFRVEFTPKLRSTFTSVFNAQTLAEEPNLGDVNLATGQFTFYTPARNDQMTVRLINDSHLPSRFISAVWEGEFSKQSR